MLAPAKRTNTAIGRVVRARSGSWSVRRTPWRLHVHAVDEVVELQPGENAGFALLGDAVDDVLARDRRRGATCVQEELEGRVERRGDAITVNESRLATHPHTRA